MALGNNFDIQCAGRAATPVPKSTQVQSENELESKIKEFGGVVQW